MEQHEDLQQRVARRFNTRVSRGQLLKSAGAGMVLAAVPTVAAADGNPPGTLEFPFLPQVQGRYTPENIIDIMNMLVTMERFVVANVTASLNGPTQPGLHPLHVQIEQASAVSALAHVDFLESLGASSLTDTYTVGGPPGENTAGSARKEMIVSIFVGAYLTAAREFAEWGQPLLTKYAFQMGAEHAEHRALARAVQVLEGVPKEVPPANKAFETNLFLYVRDAYQIMTGLGVFGALPVRLTYPSREAVLTAAGLMAQSVIQTTPNNAVTSVVFGGPSSIENART